VRYLIVNADDFGLSPGVNEGIARSHEQGVVTSASLLVRYSGAVEAAAYGRAHPELSLGLHLDLGEWVHRRGKWQALYEVVPSDDRAAVAREARQQLARFRDLVGEDPTHIDSHQHVHRDEPARSVVSTIGLELEVPIRHLSGRVRYCGDYYGQTGKGEPYHEAISMDALLRVLAALPEGVTELACHPGLREDLETMYRVERVQEVSVLCDPAIRTAIARMGIHLCSFRALPGSG